MIRLIDENSIYSNHWRIVSPSCGTVLGEHSRCCYWQSNAKHE